MVGECDGFLKNRLKTRRVADREEIRFPRKSKTLMRLTGCSPYIEILGDFSRLANPAGDILATKNPASVAALGGVRMGLAQHSRPQEIYSLLGSAATPEVRR